MGLARRILRVVVSDRLPEGYELLKSDDVVGNGEPVLVTYFRWRAERRARRLNAVRYADSYRWEVVNSGRRYAVVAMQNYLRRVE